MSETTDVIRIGGLAKAFTLHLQDGLRLPVLDGVALTVKAGEAVALVGPSGAGKSTLMRMLYGNYKCDAGSLAVRHGGRWVDLATAAPRTIQAVRRDTIGHVGQFLRVIPRVPALEVVAEPLRARGVDRQQAEQRAGELLTRLNIPEALWRLSPVTFSGGEQQRVNIARGFAAPFPVLLLDEPTASLDRLNRGVVLEMIREARDAGAAIIGIFHDEAARAAVCTRDFDLGACSETVHG